MKTITSSFKIILCSVAEVFLWIVAPFAIIIQLICFVPVFFIRLLFRLRHFLFLFYFIFAFIGFSAPEASELDVPYLTYVKDQILSGAFLSDPKVMPALILSFIGVLIIRFAINILFSFADSFAGATSFGTIVLGSILGIHSDRRGLILEMSYPTFAEYEADVRADFRNAHPDIVKNDPIAISAS